MYSIRAEVKGRAWWQVGDAAALLAATALSAATMAGAHQVTHSPWIAVVLGMVAATAVQMTFAFSAGMLLGSIETQVPAMLGGMLASMGICAAGAFIHVQVVDAVGIGTAIGLTVLLMLNRYQRLCQRGLAAWKECS